MPAKKKTTVTRRRSAKGSGETLDFVALVKAIQRVHEESAAAVNRVVNTTVTLRNWIIGAYIVEYEMRGADRAKYGEKLLDRLAERLTGTHVPSCERRRLYVYRQFFQTYPQIVESLSPLFPGASWIVQSATAQSRNRLETGGVKRGTVPGFDNLIIAPLADRRLPFDPFLFFLTLRRNAHFHPRRTKPVYLHVWHLRRQPEPEQLHSRVQIHR